jgi:excisionase family DNA binding protein
MTPKTRSIRTITPSVVARWLTVEDETVLRWIHSGDLPAMNIGTKGMRRFRIFRKDLIEFLHRRKVSPERIQEIIKF